MRIIFENEHDEKLFLEICRIITKVIEETEKFKDKQCSYI